MNHTMPGLPVPPTCGVHTNPWPSSWWCHPTISSSVIPFCSCPQFFPSSGSFQMSQLFAWGGQSVGVQLQHQSSNEHPEMISFRMDWISLQSKGHSRVFSNTTVQKHRFFCAQLSLESNSHIHTWPLEKTIALTRQTFVDKVMSLLFNMLSWWVITFLPRSKYFLISWLKSPSAVILEPRKIKSDTVSTVSPLFPMKWWDQMPWS